MLNMDDDKVYTQEVITENPLPTGEIIETTSESSGGSESTGFTQTVITNKNVPTKKVAVELLSSVLNTRTKKIMGEFEFTKSGAIKVGDYKEGLYGEVLISPTGILGRDVYGNTTFALSADTGAAVFKGEVRADDFVISDNNGIVSLSNFRNGTVTSGVYQKINTEDYEDVDDMILNIPELSREVVAMIVFTIQYNVGYNDIASPYGAWGGRFKLSIDDEMYDEMYLAHHGENSATSGGNGDQYTTSSCHFMASLEAGTHQLKMKARVVNESGAGAINCFRRTFSFAILGS